eukprot:scaffold85504_cov35-Tisochrysis_lutea.AAC.3
MQLLSCMRAPASTGPMVLPTEADSPVSEPSSVESVVVPSAMSRASAGMRSPTRTSMMSPGTSCEAGIFFRASSADWAETSCHTPTTALIARMRTMTAGSTHPFSSPSRRAKTYESAATQSRICTRRSSNWAASMRHSGVGASATSSLAPWIFWRLATCSALRPCVASTAIRASSCSGRSVYAATPSQLSSDGGACASGWGEAAPPRSRWS